MSALPIVLLLILQFIQQDRARFSDTSWQIHRTWMRNGDPLPLSPTPSRSLPAPLNAAAPAPAATTPVTLRSEQNGIYDTITVSKDISLIFK